MRVAFLSYQWPGLRMGGIGSYVRQSAAALALAGHEPHVFTVGEAGEYPANVPPGVTLHLTPEPASLVEYGQLPAELAAVVHTGGEAIYRLAIGQLLTAAMKRQHALQAFEVVEVADVDASGLPLLLEGGRDIPVIVHLHTCTAIANRIHKPKIEPADQLIEALESAQIHLADAVCAPTHAVVRSTREMMPLDREPAIIPHPFVYPVGVFAEPPADGPILFVGRLEWRKGCGVIAEMLGEFLEKNPTARFRFIGPDTSSAPGGTSVRRFIQDCLGSGHGLPVTRASGPCEVLSIADRTSLADQSIPHGPEARVTIDDSSSRVEFTGELSASEVAVALKECSFCVLPSLSENFSLSICEAMAAGRTTIVARKTGSMEVLGEAAVVVEPGSADSLLAAMDTLYRDRSRLNELSGLAFDRLRSLCDPVAISKQRVDFYRQAISEFKARVQRLNTLPAQIAATVLPCLSRMTAALMRVDEPSDSPGGRLLAIFKKVNGGKPAEVILYGAGKHTARLLSQRHCWERHGHRVLGLIDDHPRFVSTPIYLGLPVRSLADASSAGNLPAVVLSTDTYEEQFWEQTQSLRDNGVSVFKLYGG